MKTRKTIATLMAVGMFLVPGIGSADAAPIAPLYYDFTTGAAVNSGSQSVTTTTFGSPTFSATGGPTAGLGYVTLNGSNQYIQIDPTSGNLPDLGGAGGNSYTIAMWINTITPGSEFLYKGSTNWQSGTEAFYLTDVTGNAPGGFHKGTHVGGVQHGGGFTGGISNVADGNWNFISIVRNTGTNTFYVNGVPDGTDTAMNKAEQGTQMIRIGFSNNAGDGAVPFNGSISGVSVYGSALTTTEINELMAVGGPPPPPPPPTTSPLPVHRYSFDGTGGDGTPITDSTGGADGVLRGDTGGSIETALTGTGQANLRGGSSADSGYIDLPNGIVSALTEATFEAWATWESNGNWVRLFDFGDTTIGEVASPGGAFGGASNLLLTTGEGAGGGAMQFTRQEDAGGTDRLPGTQRWPIDGQEHHIAVVYTSDPTPGSGGEGLMELYFDGQFIASRTTDTTLADLVDVNNWLGRSNWSGDANFDGLFNEFRIYDQALTDRQILANFQAGPDQLNVASPNPIPEPITMTMTALAVAGLGGYIRRRKRS